MKVTIDFIASKNVKSSFYTFLIDLNLTYNSLEYTEFREEFHPYFIFFETMQIYSDMHKNSTVILSTLL